MAGKDLRSVQLLMGHKSITQTQRYAHLSPGHLREAIQILDRVPTKITTLQATKRETSA